MSFSFREGGDDCFSKRFPPFFFFSSFFFLLFFFLVQKGTPPFFFPSCGCLALDQGLSKE